MEGKSRNLQIQPNLGEIEPSKPNSKMKNQLSQTLTIPDDLIFEHILPRFPVKSLIRFKSVCKDWYNFISTSEFAKSHLQFSSSSPYFFIDKFSSLENGNRREFYLLEYDEHNNNLKELVQLDIQLANSMRKTKFVGCCNGLVCLYFADDVYSVENFLLWNPATRKRRRISTPSRVRLCKCGFGYAFALDDYKILATFCPFDDDESSTRIWVFSLQVGKWKQIDLSSDDDLFNSAGIMNGYFAGDSLYWTMFKSGGPFEHRIVCFNLVDEQFREIPVMVSASEYFDFRCFVIKGCLSLQCRAHDQSYDVWILKQQDDCNSWEKLFSMPSTLWRNNHLAFSPTGKCLVEHLKQLKLVDPTLEDLEHAHGIDFDGGVYSVHLHVESLISPISPFRTVQLYWHAWI